MPGSHSDSNGSPPHSATHSDDLRARWLGESSRAPMSWPVHAGLFAATAASVFVTFFLLSIHSGEATRDALHHAGEFASALLAILLAHEFGHYAAARLHGVKASLPYFIPMPIVSPFGTMGAVIRMRSAIPTRRALLDIGAAGPLAGLALAIPLYAWGAAHSQIAPLDGAGTELGESLLLRLLDHWFAPPVPAGADLVMSPVAYAAWAGMFVTMINLLPVGQLDGGHVAYALLGSRQNDFARWVHRSMLVFFFVSVLGFVVRDARAGFGASHLGWHLGRHVGNSIFWLGWFEVLAILGTLTSKGARSSASPDLDSGGGDAGGDTLGIRTRLLALVGLVVIAGVLGDSSSLGLWGLWFGGLALLVVMEARWGALRAGSALLDHPTTSPLPLSTLRAVIAIVTLAFFALLFMPAPFQS